MTDSQKENAAAASDALARFSAQGREAVSALPLLSPSDPARPIAFHNGTAVLVGQFQRHLAVLADRLSAGHAMINLCEDRYNFLVAYAAAISVKHTVLLPVSRAEQIVAEVAAAHPGAYRIDDALVNAALSGQQPQSSNRSSSVSPEHIVMVGFTSGSTGQPQRFPKLWRSVSASSAHNAAAIRGGLDVGDSSTPWIVATVPPQHMYGMELSILLPLLGGMAVHGGRPLFPADIAQALAEVPGPRILVSTPVHLRAMLDSPQEFPAIDLIISATAPLDAPLAAAVEARLGGHLLEMFGSTETCVFASRRTALEPSWRLYPGVELQSQADGTLVSAPWFATPILLQDLVDLQDDGRFVVRGRNTDLIEVAGKRASLADLTRRLLAIDGVQDAIVFQPEATAVATVRRVAALVVAPGLQARQVLERLAPSVDTAFMPRPLVIVDVLPRNALGKLPRESLLGALRRS